MQNVLGCPKNLFLSRKRVSYDSAASYKREAKSVKYRGACLV